MIPWTFGIVTAGKCEFLPAVINSIRTQEGLGDHEIIVVGGEPIEGVRHFPFVEEEQFNKGWITRKKNLIAEEAKYENLCIMHDYVALMPGWYLGNSKHNDWLTCMNVVLNNNGARYRDWCVIFNDSWMDPRIDNTDPPSEKPGAMLKYDLNTWGRWQYYSGTYFCAKKHVLLEVPFDETRYQNQGEDVQWSRLLFQKYGQKAFFMNTEASVKLLKQKTPVRWQDPANMICHDYK